MGDAWDRLSSIQYTQIRVPELWDVRAMHKIQPYCRSISVSRDGKTVATVANTEDNWSVSIYSSTNLVEKVTHLDKSSGATSVSLSDDGNTMAFGTKNGSARVYKRSKDEWVQLGLDMEESNDMVNNDTTVSLSGNGDTVAIGRPYQTGAETTDVNGSVRVYTYEQSEWVQKGNEMEGGHGDYDMFGYALSLSVDGRVVAVGAHEHRAEGWSDGHVRVFHYTSEGWTPLGNVIGHERRNEQLGSAVSLSGDGYTIAIGARGDRKKQQDGRVCVYTYDTTNDVWEQRGNEFESSEERKSIRNSVCLSTDGYTVAISSSSAVRVFWYNDTEWVQLGGDVDKRGGSVSISGDDRTLVVGYGSEDSVGGVSVYRWTGESTVDPVKSGGETHVETTDAADPTTKDVEIRVDTVHLHPVLVDANIWEILFKNPNGTYNCVIRGTSPGQGYLAAVDNGPAYELYASGGNGSGPTACPGEPFRLTVDDDQTRLRNFSDMLAKLAPELYAVVHRQLTMVWSRIPADTIGEAGPTQTAAITSVDNSSLSLITESRIEEVLRSRSQFIMDEVQSVLALKDISPAYIGLLEHVPFVFTFRLDGDGRSIDDTESTTAEETSGADKMAGALHSTEFQVRVQKIRHAS